jgi:galactose mutarotase-like enzyme
MLVIRAGSLEVEVDEHLGAEITRVRHRDHDLLASYDWLAPVGVSHSASYGDAKLDWLSDYRGGWQLLVPNAGAACEVAGVPLPFHGEWSRTRVTVTERSTDRVVVTAGARLPLTIEREVRAETRPDRVLVRTTVCNESAEPVPFIWGEHPAFAVGPGDRIDLPSTEIFDADGVHAGRWPSLSDGRHLDPVDTTHPHESVHFLVGFSEGWAAIRRRHLGVALAWDVADFPYAWLWHEIASPGFPFYGRTSLVAIEPASSWPGSGLSDANERGQAFVLASDERRSATVALIPFMPDGRAVSGASISGRLEFSPS